jgi:hypothetical protein
LISTLKSPRDTRSAGANPTANATSRTQAAANKNTLASIESVPNRGRSAEPTARKTWMAPSASPRPRTRHAAKHEALRHELAKHAPSAGTDACERELACPDQAACEQQVRHVDAGDQEQDRGRSGDNE